ncbi:MAG: DUF4325 domain-containing protein [Cellvibrionales bacterium]|nr:MAG: DUF4325 domain-containing protein [Cellvibrionales bacterium]
MKKMDIGKDFSVDPGGRFYSDKMPSGEQFREEHLKPCIESLAEDEKVEITLDNGVDGYGSSFLVEGFAGMVKYGYISAQDLLDKLDFLYSDPDFEFFEKKIKKYIAEAKFNSQSYISTKNN